MKTILRTTIQDLRYAFRQLIKLRPASRSPPSSSRSPSASATTAVFSASSTPHPHGPLSSASALPTAWSTCASSLPPATCAASASPPPNGRSSANPPSSKTHSSRTTGTLTVTGSDFPEDLQAVYLTSNGFNFFGVPAFLGRGLQPSDAIDGQDPQPIAVLGYKFWQRHFNADRSVIGKTIQMVRKNYTIVGIAAPRFTWGDGDVYLPLKITGDQARSYYVGTRLLLLKPGVTLTQADAALQPPTFRSSLARPPRTSLTMRSASTSSASMKTSASSSAKARSICSSMFRRIALADRLRQRSPFSSARQRATSPPARVRRPLRHRRQPHPHHSPAPHRSAPALHHRRRPRPRARL